MPTPTDRVVHQDFSAGMVQDAARYAIPDNAAWEIVDGLVDDQGRVRKRGGTVGRPGGPQGAVYDRVVALADDIAVPSIAYAIDVSNAQRFKWVVVGGGTGQYADPTLTRFRSLAAGQPFAHGGLVVTPLYDTTRSLNSIPMLVLGGSAMNIPLNHLAVSFKASSTTGTIASDGTSNSGQVEVGGFLLMGTTAAMQGSKDQLHICRVVEVNGSSVTVSPAPPTDCASGQYYPYLPDGSAYPSGATAAPAGMPAGARCGTSFQNRIILANLLWAEAQPVAAGADLSTLRYSAKPNRVAWSCLPTEVPSRNPAMIPDLIGVNYGIPLTGLTTYMGVAFEPGNWTDVQGLPYIVAVAPAGEGQLIVFGPRSTHRITGSFLTQTGTQGGVTFQTKRISQTVGCVSERSIQNTAFGLLFADRSGVQLYDGARMQNLMRAKIQRLWMTTLKAKRDAGGDISGSAIVGGTHYLISFSDGDGFLCNLNSGAWTRVSNLPITGSTTDPVDPSTGTIVSLGARGVASVAELLAPSSTNRLDDDGTPVLMKLRLKAYQYASIMERRYHYSSAAALKLFRRVLVNIRMVSPGSAPTKVRVSVILGPSGGGEQVTLGTVTSAPNQDTYEFDFQFDRISAGLAVEFEMLQPADETEVFEMTSIQKSLRMGRLE